MAQQPTDEQKEQIIRKMLKNIEMRIEEAKERDDYEDMRVDLLAIVEYIKRQLTLLEGVPPF